MERHGRVRKPEAQRRIQVHHLEVAHGDASSDRDAAIRLRNVHHPLPGGLPDPPAVPGGRNGVQMPVANAVCTTFDDEEADHLILMQDCVKPL